MVIITLFGKDKSKQMIKTSDKFEVDPQGQSLTHSKLAEKVKEIGHDVLKNNYFNSNFEKL